MAKEPDPRAELAELERQLARGLLPGYVLRGGERYFRDRALELVLAKARAEGQEVCRHDAKAPEFSLPALLDDLCGASLFAAQRCVLVQEPEELLRKSAGKESPLARAVAAFVRARRGTALLVADALRKDNATLKAIVAAGGAEHAFRALYDAPPPWGRDQDPARSELAQWIAARGRELGARLDREQVLLLQYAKGNDLAALDGELALLARGGGRVVHADAAGSPFQLADSLARGDLRKALREIETLYRGGLRRERDGTRDLDRAALFAVLSSALRRILRQAHAGRTALDAGADLKSAADEAGVPTWPAARSAFGELVNLRSSAGWRAMLEDLVALERASRGSASIDQNALALLALRHQLRPARAPARAR